MNEDIRTITNNKNTNSLPCNKKIYVVISIMYKGKNTNLYLEMKWSMKCGVGGH
jgi:hypothetical protein